MKSPLLITLIFTLTLSACSTEGTDKEKETSTVSFSVPENIARSEEGNIFPEETGFQYNSEAVIPPQCYTRHEETYTPCMTCHQSYAYNSRPNTMNDSGLQSEYAFSDVGFTNHWQNLFEDRRERMAQISDQTVIDYLYTDNYSTLIEQLEKSTEWDGPVPKIENLHLGAEAFDNLGFAKDGSDWVAFNYKPLPSTFWPTNGATDDVMIRLPTEFRSNSCNGGGYSLDTYIANLAIAEMTIQDLSSVTVPIIDENKVCQDLDNNGLLEVVERIQSRDFYVGDASTVPVTKMLYPQGTEFLHTVRYVGLDQAGSIMTPARMKEVRYMKKHSFYSEADLHSRYGNEKQEKTDGNLPQYINRGTQGTDNGFGWMVLGFIEAGEGHLRLQSQEETLFCMGCHTTIGSTIDQTFAFPRKVTGVKGWGYINLKGMPDAPYVNQQQQAGQNAIAGEIFHYLEAVGGGNEFRENQEVVEKWFNADGSLNREAIQKADVYTLITPSTERALALNKAYMTIVQDQDYIHGRDANIAPVTNVYQTIDPETAPVLPEDKKQQWDIRLDWSAM